MQVSVETTSSIGRRLTIQVPAEQVDQAVENRLRETGRRARLNGFRPGKVPMSVVRSRFGAETRAEVVGDVIRQNYMQAISKESLNAAGFPEIDLKVNEAGKDLEFTADLEIIPEIDVKGIDGVSVERPVADITDADVDATIENLRKQAADWQESEKAAENDDQITIDFEGFLGEEPFEGGKAEGHALVLGSGSFIPGFEDQLIGTKAGEELVVKVTFPEEYHAEQLAGKEATFKTRVHKVESQQLPEVDAEFMKRFGVEDGDQEAFRTQIRDNMVRELDGAVENSVKQQVIAALKKANPIDVPKGLVQQGIDDLKRQAAAQFGLGDDFDLNQLPNELFEEQARDRAQAGLLLGEFITANDITATDEETRDFAAKVAEQYGQSEELVEQYMQDEQVKNNLQSIVRENKAVEQLLAQADVKDVKLPFQEAMAAAQSNPAEEAEEENDADA